MRTLCSTLLGLGLMWLAVDCAAAEQNAPAAARVEELAPMLPGAPRGVGPTIDDRPAWRAVAAAAPFRDAVGRAEGLLKQSLGEVTDELFLDFSRTGNRTRCQEVIFERRGRMHALLLAECLENRGRFLPAIEESIRSACSEKTWVLPAHDRGLDNFHGRTVEIDLVAADVSWTLATACWWLGDRLSPDVRRLVRDELERRCFAPFTGMVTRGKPRPAWLTCTNNWNAVCLAGVTGAALAVIESPQRRAFFAAATEKNIQHFVDGFTADGYCSEGVGYWDYGFGHYILLAETLHQATGGRLDLMEGPKIRQIALFCRRLELTPDVFPAFADCRTGARPDLRLMAFLSRRYGWGLKRVEAEGLLLAAGAYRPHDLGILGFANSASRRPAVESSPPQPPRDWFPDAGILICRSESFAAALKGGHNAEHHNHNDVGSFVVALGPATPLVDPGAEVYTARTFSSRRYESKVLNSFGHAVPRVAGRLQRTGRAAAAKVVRTDFTPKADTLVLDIASCYGVKSLRRLQRTFVFSREGKGSLTVADEVELSSLESFGTALITLSKWKQLGPNRLVVGEGAEAVQVDIAAGGQEFRIEPDEIKEDMGGRRAPVRLGIELVRPTTKATVVVTIAPAQ